MHGHEMISPSGRLYVLRHPGAKPLISNPADFVRGLYQSWRICLDKDERGTHQSEIGLAFYSAMTELFERTPNSIRAPDNN